jgi:hypothetical protein
MVFIIVRWSVLYENIPPRLSTCAHNRHRRRKKKKEKRNPKSAKGRKKLEIYDSNYLKRRSCPIYGLNFLSDISGTGESADGDALAEIFKLLDRARTFWGAQKVFFMLP